MFHVYSSKTMLCVMYISTTDIDFELLILLVLKLYLFLYLENSTHVIHTLRLSISYQSLVWFCMKWCNDEKLIILLECYLCDLDDCEQLPFMVCVPCTLCTFFSFPLFALVTLICVHFHRHHHQAIRQVHFHSCYPLFASCSDDGSVVVCHGMVYRFANQKFFIHTHTKTRGYMHSIW